MEIVEILFKIYIAVIACIKAYIWIKCRKVALGCKEDCCSRCLRCFCPKHHLSPLDRAIVQMEAAMGAGGLDD